MAKLDAGYFESHKAFLAGLALILAGLALFFFVGSTDVRFDLEGLQEVRGRVLEAESYKPGRHSSYQLVVKLDTGSGVLRLSQEATGYFAGRLTPGQSIRAWVNPPSGDQVQSSSRTVWQIERGSQIVMPVMEVGDRVLNRLLWDGGAALIPLLGGLFMVGRHLVRYHDSDDTQGREGETSA
jgi:hypothetical protein